ncbi:iron-containing alcohol dehydrogenase [Alphaproteobacteria bacterium]|nr:iron-containing alcohol dehydrogenase [Alphaproteobacteria bacterium]MDA9558633.1 iron-containing alcohol dehydrogenase [Alphaproteobacteria bacterium]
MDINFKTVSWIESGLGKISILSEICIKLNINRPIIITDKGLYKLGYIDKINTILKKNNIQSSVYKDVLADPPEYNIFEAVKLFHEFEADGVIGLGGGSSMDVAKAVSYFSINKIPIEKCYGVNKLVNKRSPLIQIPTTAGTGSELTPISIFTLKSQQKMGIVDPLLYADCAILDADLTLELPKDITAYSGIDAMVHAIEAYTTKLKKNPISDALAKKALSLLGENLRIVVDEPSNRIAREKMLLGSMLAGMAFSNAPCAGVHALAYPIGAKFHVPHGLSNSLVLSKVLKFNSLKVEKMYCEIAQDCLPHLKGKTIKIDDFIQGIEQLIVDLKIPKCLRDVGISHNDIPKLAEDSIKQQRLLINNPRDLNLDDAISIYKAAL